MAVEDWIALAPRDLIKLRHSLGGGTPDAYTVDRILEQKIEDREAEGGEKAAASSEKLVSSTDKLVAATHRLGTATWWLVGGTFLLGASSAATDVIFKLWRGH